MRPILLSKESVLVGRRKVENEVDSSMIDEIEDVVLPLERMIEYVACAFFPVVEITYTQQISISVIGFCLLLNE
jgi:hypothetical protein